MSLKGNSERANAFLNFCTFDSISINKQVAVFSDILADTNSVANVGNKLKF